MKHGGDYARRLRHLFHQLVRKFGKPTPPEPTEPLEQMVIAILSGNTSHYKALAAFRKLREQMVDLNELRVTPVTELARFIGAAIPQAELKAQRIVEVLNDIRRRHDTLDLSFLKQRGRREAASTSSLWRASTGPRPRVSRCTVWAVMPSRWMS